MDLDDFAVNYGSCVGCVAEAAEVAAEADGEWEISACWGYGPIYEVCRSNRRGNVNACCFHG